MVILACDAIWSELLGFTIGWYHANLPLSTFAYQPVANMRDVCLRQPGDPFNWNCVNLLIGLGDAFSTDVANAFEAAAIENQIDVCTKATYEAGSVDMSIPIHQIIDNRCCLVTVLVGQVQDVSSLLLEGHRQGYTGEWYIPDSAKTYVDGIVRNLQKHLDDSSIHELMRGIVGPRGIYSNVNRKILACCLHVLHIDLITCYFTLVIFIKLSRILAYAWND